MKANSNTITAIVDTNYILNHLDLFLPSVDIQPLNKKFQIILLPPVVQELDGLKNKRGEAGFKAREFNRRLNKILTSREKTLCGYEINNQCILNLPNFHIDQNQNIKSMDNLILSYAKEFKRIYGKELNLYFLTDDIHFQNKVINESFNYELPIFFYY